MSNRLSGCALAPALAMSLTLATPAGAGREPEPWDNLPKIHGLTFSEASVGLVTSDQGYFVFDRARASFARVEAGDFHRLLPGGAEAARMTPLHTSSGRIFQAAQAYCSEGQGIHHRLSDEDGLVPDHVDPCFSVSAVEIVGDELWIGTRTDGEYGEYPAEGVVIQSLDGARLIRRLQARDGLTGDLVRVIRRDPYRGNVWIATERGFDEVDVRGNIVESHHLFEGFDPKSGAATIQLSDTARPSDPLAVLQRELAVTDVEAYYRAVLDIPAETRSGLRQLDEAAHHGGFFPQDVNALVPFALAAARSEDPGVRRHGLAALCAFKDARAVHFMRELEDQSGSSPASQTAARCIDRYRRAGLLDRDALGTRSDALLRQAHSALDAIRRSRPDRSPPNSEVETLLRSARSLRQMGSTAGIEAINAYFEGSSPSRRDSSLFDRVTQSFLSDVELAPGVVSGLKKLSPERVGGGCQFFNNQLETAIGGRYDARYAEAVLIALDRMHERERRDEWPRPSDWAKTTCASALASQLGNESVRSEFVRDVYPTLPADRKALADSFLD